MNYYNTEALIDELRNQVKELKEKVTLLENITYAQEVDEEVECEEELIPVPVSTLFFRNLTAIDHAYLNPETGQIIGGSFHLNCTVTGTVEEHEQVVVDFSTIKKTIKEIIDAKEDGFDHKLWVFVDSAYENVYTYVDFYHDYKTNYQITYIDKDDGTELFRFVCPMNAVKIIHGDPSQSIMKLATVAIENQLNEKLSAIYPHVQKLQVAVELTEEVFSQHPFRVEFRYVHGLKNSSSWGCQNMNHGHYSFMELYDGDGTPIEFPREFILYVVSSCYKPFLFINYIDSLQYPDAKGMLRLRYSTERGDWISSYKRSLYTVVDLAKDTTIENIIDWFAEILSTYYLSPGNYRLFVSEGLQKGAMIKFCV